MATTLAMFPGQGSQYVGMGKTLLEQFPYVGEVFEEASESAAVDLKKLCFEGPEEELKLTANTQPCILTVSVATWRVLLKECGIQAEVFAGHSLGEYSALVAADRLDLGRAAYLVRERGKAMQTAVPPEVGAMAAVMNMDAGELEALCAEHHRDDNVVQPVNYNSPQQIVIAGHKGAVEAVGKVLDERGVRFVMLNVSAPFHSSLMSPARNAMAGLLKDTTFHNVATKFIANLTGAVAADYNHEYLAKQIDHPVKWTQSMVCALEQGCDTYVEVGPGKVLFGLARRCLPKGQNLVTTDDIGKALETLKA